MSVYSTDKLQTLETLLKTRRFQDRSSQCTANNGHSRRMVLDVGGREISWSVCSGNWWQHRLHCLTDRLTPTGTSYLFLRHTHRRIYTHMYSVSLTYSGLLVQFSLSTGWGESLNSGRRNLASICRTVHKVFRHLEPYRFGSRLWQTGRRTDRFLTAYAALHYVGRRKKSDTFRIVIISSIYTYRIT